MGFPSLASELRTGSRFAELEIGFDLELMQSYESVVPHYANIHDSYEAAKGAGFAQPFASGTMLIAYTVEHLIPSVFGDGWDGRGTTSLTFLRPIAPGDRVTLAAEVVAKLPRGDKTEVVLALTASLEDGSQVATGSASAVVA